MLTLADVAEVGTAEIPEQWTPSLTVLAAETGLSKRTVQRHLDDLDEAGWIKRERPDKKAQWRGERVRYTLLCPIATESTPQASERPEGVDTETRVVSESPGGVVTESTTCGHSDHPNQISSDQSDHSSSPAASKPKKRTKKPEPQRDDVSQLCALLTKWVAENGFNTPADDTEWRREARLMLDTDKRELDKALALIDWCQQNQFWRKNIRSMGKFRDQYNRLRLDAVDDWEKQRKQRDPQGAKSTAPDVIPESEKCEHKKRASTCGLCRAEKLGGTPQ